MKGDASISALSSAASSPYLPLLPLSLALLYAVSAHVFQAAWHDVAWFDRERCRSVAGRAALLGAAAVATAGSALAGGLPRAQTPPAHAATTTLTTLWSTAASAYLMQQTRQRHVQGPHRTGTLTSHSLRGRVYFITGANTGVGYATARQLYEAGATVVLGCRSEGKAREAMGRIQRMRTSAVSGEEGAKRKEDMDDERLVFVHIDVSDLTSVRRAARHFQSLSLPLHTLILNAGIMMADRRDSVDGHELTLAANHLGHFLLTNLLLPSMRTVDDPRVVVLTSSTYQLASPGGIDWDDLQCRHRPYAMFGQYAQTKLANILFVKELARREETLRQAAVGADAKDDDGDGDAEESTTAAIVKAYAVHPGLVRTDVVRNMPWYLYYPNTLFGFAVAAVQKTPEAGAWTTVFCATSADVLEESGSYYVNSRREAVEDFANDEEAASKLWTISEELVGLKR